MIAGLATSGVLITWKKQKEQEAMASASCVSPQQQFEYYQQKKQHQLCTPSAVELENSFNCKSTLNSQTKGN